MNFKVSGYDLAFKIRPPGGSTRSDVGRKTEVIFKNQMRIKVGVQAREICPLPHPYPPPPPPKKGEICSFSKNKIFF